MAPQESTTARNELDELIAEFERQHGKGKNVSIESTGGADMSQDAVYGRMLDAAKGMIDGDRASNGQSKQFQAKWDQLKDADTPGSLLARNAMRQAANEKGIPLP